MEKLLVHILCHVKYRFDLFSLRCDPGYGKLFIDSLPNYPLVLELLKGDEIVRRIKARHTTSIDSLKAGTYSLRIIEDENENGVWDSGKLIHKRTAEKVWLYPKEIKIRDNWDVVIEWETNQ